MDIDEIQTLWKEDSQIDEDNLHGESTRIPSLHAKYHQILNKMVLLKKMEETKFKISKKEKWQYYTGKADASVYAKKPFNFKLLRQDVDQYIQSNEEYIKAKQKVDYLNATVDFLDRTIRQITNRTFTIKNAIDWRKFTSGAI